MHIQIEGITFPCQCTLLKIVPSTDVSCAGKLRPIHASTISMLSDDVLLEIFDFCQKNHTPGPQCEALPGAVWDWQILVHVCQRWRQVVFASPLRLNLRILCKPGTPVRKHLDIWPIFPIHIEYMIPEAIEGIDDNIVAALEHPDRVSAVGLYRVTGPQLGTMIAVMQEPFPALTHLCLTCMLNDVPLLPSEFLGRSAPCLRTIKLVGIPFPALPVLLLSTSDLVTLHIFNIPQTGYISPEAMVAALATLSRLEDLDIGFQSPASRPDQIRLLPVTQTILPSLTHVNFRGVREYLEDFAARIDAPRLQKIWISYFNQPFDFEVPQLCHFIERTLADVLNRPLRCSVEFYNDFVTLTAGPTTDVPESESFEIFPSCIDVNILCKGVDWQVSHVAQVLNQVPALLSSTIHFAIIAYSISPEPEDMDDVEWMELLRPISSVQALFVSREFSGHVSRALEDIVGWTVTDVLPDLDVLCLEDQPVSTVHKFIAARLESDCPVTTVDSRMEFKESLIYT